MNIRSQIFGQEGLAESPLVRVKNPMGATADALLSIPVRRHEARTSDTRHEHRFLLAGETATLVRKGAAHDVRVVNVCGGGAMITAAFEPTLWERFDLHLGEHGSVECSVIWIKHGRVGVEFAHETRLDCEEDQQGTLLREVIHRHFPEAQFEAPLHVEEPDEEEHRRAARHPFVWSATLHCEYGSAPARLRNISPEGAMIETSFELAPGSEPYLDLGEAGSVFGTIVWSTGDHSGLEFHQRFDMALLARAKPQLSADCTPLVRLGPGPRSGEGWQASWKRMIANDPGESGR
jgi:hypothetical protein